MCEQAEVRRKERKRMERMADLTSCRSKAGGAGSREKSQPRFLSLEQKGEDAAACLFGRQSGSRLSVDSLMHSADQRLMPPATCTRGTQPLSGTAGAQDEESGSGQRDAARVTSAAPVSPVCPSIERQKGKLQSVIEAKERSEHQYLCQAPGVHCAVL